ncbi:MAG: thioredoxin family protein [Candidatus Melainabacteria bacterium]|nr:thioredoxin family protein [Candidatus Melainabacteria bacterium]
MKRKVWQHLIFSLFLTLSCATAASSHSEVFSEYSFEQAKQQAQKDSKYLLVDFTASWCPPCKKMESTTWTDESVQAWIKENAIAVQVDVDKDKKSTEALNVEAMPTIVLFTPQSGAKEFGRQVGFMGASELLQWLEGAKSGKTSVELEKQAESGGADVWEHLSKARDMQSSGKNAEALEEYLWLWNNIKAGDQNVGDLRRSMVPFELKKLTATYAPAKSKISEMRDAAEKAENRHDWLLLNGVLEDNARSLAWFDKTKNNPEQREIFKKHIGLLEPVLFSNTRYGDVANFLYPDPMAQLQELYKRAQDMKKPRPDTEVAKDFDAFPSMVLLLYGAYVGANRDAEAQKIADECLRLDDTPAMREGLKNMATGMRKAREALAKPAPNQAAK